MFLFERGCGACHPRPWLPDHRCHNARMASPSSPRRRSDSSTLPSFPSLWGLCGTRVEDERARSAFHALGEERSLHQRSGGTAHHRLTDSAPMSGVADNRSIPALGRCLTGCPIKVRPLRSHGICSTGLDRLALFAQSLLLHAYSPS